MKKETTNMIVRSIGVPHSFFVLRKNSAEPANGIIHDSRAGEKKKIKMTVLFRRLSFEILFDILQPGQAVICHFLPTAFTDYKMVAPRKLFEICDGGTPIFSVI